MEIHGEAIPEGEEMKDWDEMHPDDRISAVFNSVQAMMTNMTDSEVCVLLDLLNAHHTRQMWLIIQEGEENAEKARKEGIPPPKWGIKLDP